MGGCCMVGWTRILRDGLIAYTLIFSIGSVIYYLITPSILGVSMLFIMPLVIYPIARFSTLRGLEARLPMRCWEGFKTGLAWMLLAILLDTLILVYGFGIGWDFFLKADWTLPAGYAEYVLSVTLASIFVKKE